VDPEAAELIIIPVVQETPPQQRLAKAIPVEQDTQI